MSVGFSVQPAIATRRSPRRVHFQASTRFEIRVTFTEIRGSFEITSQFPRLPPGELRGDPNFLNFFGNPGISFADPPETQWVHEKRRLKSRNTMVLSCKVYLLEILALVIKYPANLDTRANHAHPVVSAREFAMEQLNSIDYA